MDNGNVFFLGLAVFKLMRNSPVGGFGFCADHNACRVAVEAVDDTGSQFAAAFGQVVAMEDKAIDERAVEVAAGRMDDEVGLLVYYDDVVVFIDDIERNIFGFDLFCGQWRENEIYYITLFEAATRLDYLVVDLDSLFLDYPLDHGSAILAKTPLEVFVDTSLLYAVADVEAQMFRAAFTFGAFDDLDYIGFNFAFEWL